MTIELDEFATLLTARQHWNAGRYDVALESFAKTVAERPGNIRALCEGARAWGQRFELKQAEQWLHRADEMAGRDVRVAIVIAQTYAMIGRPERAIATYEQVRRQVGLEPAALAALAELYEQTNRLADAEESVRESVQRSGGRPEAQLILARILRRRNNAAEAESQLLQVTSRTDVRANVLAHAWSELANIHDAQGQYYEAVANIEKSKQLLRNHPDSRRLVAQADLHNQLFRQLYAELDRETIRRWQTEGGPADGPRLAHLTGFPRTGTTLLEQVIGAHPGLVDLPEKALFTQVIFPALYKPTGQESLTLDALKVPAEHLKKLRRRYFEMAEGILNDTLNGRVLLDKNPNHTSLLAGIVRLFPQSKILFSLRDPRDVIVSCYLRLFSLSEFSSCFLSWKETANLYAAEMNLWLTLRPLLTADQWIEVRYEDTVTELAGQARRVLEFLELPWDARVLEYRTLGTHKHVNSPSHDMVRQPVYRHAVERWKNYERHLTPYLSILQPFIKAFGYE